MKAFASIILAVAVQAADEASYGGHSAHYELNSHYDNQDAEHHYYG